MNVRKQMKKNLMFIMIMAAIACLGLILYLLGTL